MTFQQDTEETPVLFRMDGCGDVVAVFPCEAATYDGSTMTCYVHVGQHGQCSLDWYRRSRPAAPSEYAELRRELEGAPYGYRLRVYRRMTRQLRDRFNAAVAAL